MSDLPTYADAAILIALVWGGDPEAVLAATDHINAGYCEFNEWVHACDLLGRLGLIAHDEPLPYPTQAGKEIVNRYCPSGMPPRTGAMKVREALVALPSVADPIPPPVRSVLDDAVGKLERRREAWFDRRFPPQSPRWSDAWVLVSLFLGKGDPVATLGAADHLNHAYPNAEEWTHACAVLGRIGLILSGDSLPRLTPLGESILHAHIAGISFRSTLASILADVSKLPVIAEPAVPPASEVLAKASVTIQSQGKQWFEEWMTDTAPILRDAWILASMSLGKAVDWKSVSIGEEDGPAQPTDADWHHAIAVLSKRGLVARQLMALRATEAGTRLVESCSPNEPSMFRFVLCVLEAIKKTPADQPVLSPRWHWFLRHVEQTLGWR